MGSSSFSLATELLVFIYRYCPAMIADLHCCLCTSSCAQLHDLHYRNLVALQFPLFNSKSTLLLAFSVITTADDLCYRFNCFPTLALSLVTYSSFAHRTFEMTNLESPFNNSSEGQSHVALIGEHVGDLQSMTTILVRWKELLQWS